MVSLSRSGRLRFAKGVLLKVAAMSHTRKHFILLLSDDAYEYTVFSSGGVLHTVEMKCVLNGRTEKHSFKGFDKAKEWIRQKIDYHAFCKSSDLHPPA